VEHRPLKLRFIAEAKQVWPCLTKPNSLRGQVTKAFEQLQGELASVDDAGWPRWMFVFVTPWTSTSKGSSPVNKPRLRNFVQALCELDDVAVWTFPEWGWGRKIDYPRRTTFYPGVALLAREL
jgi:hypothetical protein